MDSRVRRLPTCFDVTKIYWLTGVRLRSRGRECYRRYHRFWFISWFDRIRIEKSSTKRRTLVPICNANIPIIIWIFISIFQPRNSFVRKLHRYELLQSNNKLFSWSYQQFRQLIGEGTNYLRILKERQQLSRSKMQFINWTGTWSEWSKFWKFESNRRFPKKPPLY